MARLRTSVARKNHFSQRAHRVRSPLGRVDGGDGVEYPNTLTKALPLTRNIDMIITGHGGVAKPQDLAVHRDFMRDFLESTRQA